MGSIAHVSSGAFQRWGQQWGRGTERQTLQWDAFSFTRWFAIPLGDLGNLGSGLFVTWWKYNQGLNIQDDFSRVWKVSFLVAIYWRPLDFVQIFLFTVTFYHLRNQFFMGRVLGTTQDESGWIVATHKHTSKATFIGYPGTSPQKELIYFNPSTDWQKTILYNSIKWVKVRSWLGEYVICITSTDLWLPWDCAWLHFRDNYVCCRGSLLCVATCYHFAILWKNICKYYITLLSICYQFVIICYPSYFGNPGWIWHPLPMK